MLALAVPFFEFKIPFACSAVDLRTGKIVTLKEGDLIKSVQASATIPGVFRPVEEVIKNASTMIFKC